MKRRRFVKGLLALPAAPALVAQQQQPAPGGNQAALPGTASPQTAGESPALETAISDAAAEMVPRFFTSTQFAALRQLSGILMPPINGAPGALEAHAPEFLDFLIGQSPPERQQLYQAGLDTLNAQAKKRFNKTFAEADAAETAALLASLREPWTPEPPAEPLARFLHAAKQDIRTATTNSPEWSAAGLASGGRRPGGFNQYWLPID
jgi:hypothetical protein